MTKQNEEQTKMTFSQKIAIGFLILAGMAQFLNMYADLVYSEQIASVTESIVLLCLPFPLLYITLMMQKDRAGRDSQKNSTGE